jgi:3-hydroxyacyl-CoA dehydrogenase
LKLVEISMGMHTKEEWKEKTLDYLKEHKDRDVTVKDLCYFYGGIPLELKEAYDELKKEKRVNTVLDDKGKEWMRYKEDGKE